MKHRSRHGSSHSHYSKSLNDHVDHLRQVLLVLRENHLFANVEKCTFCVDNVIFLGFVVSKKGDLLPLLDIASFIHKEGTSRVDFVKKLHERVVFNEGDWVWLHLRKERFPSKRKSKLRPRGDGPFQVLKKINNNAYVLDLPSEYRVSPNFNISDLSLFTGVADQEEDSLDLRSNPLQGGGDDGGPWAKGPNTRAMAKRIQEEWVDAKEKPIVLFHLGYTCRIGLAH
uniref:Tf2-1-like SH3-like domain-containing protein n=1 Tax=Cajanus cajan TaxID=3821 RepID=A0A151QRR8_CAJCA|nr:hypothetical protein KK1_046208 [Cajanus cajan]